MESREAAPWAAGARVRVESPLEALAPAALVETEEIEHQGQVYRIPAALKGAFLRQADYTRKTQALADDRRAYMADREALNHWIETHGSSLGDLVLWVALNRTGFGGEGGLAPELTAYTRSGATRAPAGGFLPPSVRGSG